MELFFMALFDLLFRRADIEFPPRAGQGPIQFMQNDFDAKLSNISWMDDRVRGYISGDKKGRFDDGTRIMTSVVEEVYIVTRNSIYKVTDGSWVDNPRRQHGTATGQFDHRDPRQRIMDAFNEPDHIPGEEP